MTISDLCSIWVLTTWLQFVLCSNKYKQKKTAEYLKDPPPLQKKRKSGFGAWLGFLLLIFRPHFDRVVQFIESKPPPGCNHPRPKSILVRVRDARVTPIGCRVEFHVLMIAEWRCGLGFFRGQDKNREKNQIVIVRLTEIYGHTSSCIYM